MQLNSYIKHDESHPEDDFGINPEQKQKKLENEVR